MSGAASVVNLYLHGHYLKLQGDCTRRFGETSASAVSIVRVPFDGTF